MPLPVTSSSGSAVTLIPPPSQQTAPVHEFRCLFTHDVRRKAKRWQDGYLTFHTFNNRAIVYDEHRHKIGDVYTKSGGGAGAGAGDDGGVHEGDEFTLQQGVLVEVGEALGSREQDVSSVVVAREAPRNVTSQATVSGVRGAGLARGQGTGSGAGNGFVATTRQMGPPALAPMPTSGAAAGAMPLQKPKSLKELLSTPAGSIGRARLFRSPYERRQGLAGASGHRQDADQPVQVCRLAPAAAPARDQGEMQRPSKRQRVEDNRLESPALQRPSTKQVQKRHTIGTATPAKEDIRATPPRPGTRAASPIVLESDEDSTLQSSLNITPMASRVELEPQNEPELERSLPTSVPTMAVNQQSPLKPIQQRQPKQTNARVRSDKRPSSKVTEQQNPLERTVSEPAAETPVERPSKKRKANRPEALTENSAKQKQTNKKKKEKKKARGEPQNRDSMTDSASVPEIVDLSSNERTERSTSARPLRERSGNTLRLSSTGRRRNIMYKDLLPDGFVPRKAPSHPSTRENETPSGHSGRSSVRPSSLAEAAASLSITVQKRRQKAKRTATLIFEDFDEDDDAALLVLEQEAVPAPVQNQEEDLVEQGGDNAHDKSDEDALGQLFDEEPDTNQAAVPDLSCSEGETNLSAADVQSKEQPSRHTSEVSGLADANNLGRRSTIDAIADFSFESELDHQLEPVMRRDEPGSNALQVVSVKQGTTLSSAEAMPPPAVPPVPSTDTNKAATPLLSNPVAEQHKPQTTALQDPPSARQQASVQAPVQVAPPAPILAQSNTSAATSTIFRGMPPYRRPQPAAKLPRPREPAASATSSTIEVSTRNDPAPEQCSAAAPETSHSLNSASRPQRSVRRQQPQVRSPLKRVISAPAPESPRQKRPLVKSFSELGTGGEVDVGTANGRGGQRKAPDPFGADRMRDRENDRGPWSTEAFDLFGWRPGDKKGVDDVG